MKFFNSPEKPVHLVLKRDNLRDIRRGYPWVFKDALKELPETQSGSVAVLKDSKRTIVAKGLYDPGSPLAFRVFVRGKEALDDDIIEERLERALELRLGMFSSDTNAYRLINGEGDLLPGLVCDRYADSAVFQLDGAGPAGFWNVSEIAAWLQNKASLKHAIVKPRKSSEAPKVLFGSKSIPEVKCLEHGVSFLVDIMRGQKTGFFLDQRDNRKLIGQFASGKRVLNLFSYTGGFSVYAGLGGARHVTSVDSANPAIEALDKNWKLNELDPALHQGVARDAFAFLEDALKQGRSWDLVIVDPPSFASSAKNIEAASLAYRRLFELSMKVVSARGQIATSSCSSRITLEAFMQINQEALSRAKRTAQILAVQGQPADHPFPLACPELRYLKFILMNLVLENG